MLRSIINFEDADAEELVEYFQKKRNLKFEENRQKLLRKTTKIRANEKSLRFRISESKTSLEKSFSSSYFARLITPSVLSTPRSISLEPYSTSPRSSPLTKLSPRHLPTRPSPRFKSQALRPLTPRQVPLQMGKTSPRKNRLSPADILLSPRSQMSLGGQLSPNLSSKSKPPPVPRLSLTLFDPESSSTDVSARTSRKRMPRLTLTQAEEDSPRAASKLPNRLSTPRLKGTPSGISKRISPRSEVSPRRSPLPRWTPRTLNPWKPYLSPRPKPEYTPSVSITPRNVPPKTRMILKAFEERKQYQKALDALQDGEIFSGECLNPPSAILIQKQRSRVPPPGMRRLDLSKLKK